MVDLTPLKPNQFRDFFRALYHFDPFPWQEDLAERVATAANVEKAWPQAMALPTASGKTACIDIAVFALACQADWGTRRTAPRRIFFVVDRRVIVDEAHDRAVKLAEHLGKANRHRATASPVLVAVAERLMHLAAGPDDRKRKKGSANPLECHQLRGGVYRDDAWARTPIQPTVIASTVDQIGSRLLYRGYGLRSGLARPIHAALAGNDCLILLDEAHCAVPFGQTAAAVARYRTWADVKVRTPFAFVPMSATVRAEAGDEPTDVVRLTDRDRANETLGKRLTASKPATLVVATKAKGAKAIDRLADELVKQATRMTEGGMVKRVGVLVNRVATARKIARLLKEAGHDVVLMTGRMRPYDRDWLMDEWRPAGVTSGPQGLREWLAAKQKPLTLDKPVFVIATQCLEVGANLDFEAMVSECASLDALRQRYGRLNRLGLLPRSPGVIVIRADQLDSKDVDPVYGTALAETWAWLQARAKGDGTVDMGIAAVEEGIASQRDEEPDFPRRLQPPTRNAPVMLAGHVDCWVQTAPAPTPDPDVALFLHGPDSGQADVRVCWRADLEATPPESNEIGTSESAQHKDDDQRQLDIIALCPPTSAECMPVPFLTFRRWLAGRAEELNEPDVEGVVPSVADDGGDAAGTPEPLAIKVVRWLGPDQSEVIVQPGDVYPGDTLVLATSAGGYHHFGDIPERPENDTPIDIGDAAYRRAKSRAVLRLHDSLVAKWPPTQAVLGLRNLLAEKGLLDLAGEPEFTERIRGALESLAADEKLPEWLRENAKELTLEPRRKFARAIVRHPGGGVVVIGSQPLSQKGSDQETFTDEDDTASATVPVTIIAHCEAVERWVDRFATGIGLSDDIVADLKLAARLHDYGKADPRFQIWLHGGNAIAASRCAEPLAKSGGMPLGPAARAAARERSRYPKGGRHEFLSLVMVEKLREACTSVTDWDLIQHLIASHHGHCRPLAPVINDPKPPSFSFDHDGHAFTFDSSKPTSWPLHAIGSGVPDRFWRLVRKYGWWGLALLESVLRLADHRCSADEQDAKHRADESNDREVQP